jgi:ElaB/YqjD/DUF883 family membrane-anchored ribosome-binding protein
VTIKIYIAQDPPVTKKRWYASRSSWRRIMDTNEKIENLKKQLEETKKRPQQWERQAETRIKEKPIQSVLIAVGVAALAGALLAAMMSRK